jgi:hypothetical protein
VKVYLTSSSAYSRPTEVIDIASLEQLLALLEQERHPLIIMPKDDKGIYTIEIYDDYRE